MAESTFVNATVPTPWNSAIPDETLFGKGSDNDMLKGYPPWYENKNISVSVKNYNLYLPWKESPSKEVLPQNTPKLH